MPPMCFSNRLYDEGQNMGQGREYGSGNTMVAPLFSLSCARREDGIKLDEFIYGMRFVSHIRVFLRRPCNPISRYSRSNLIFSPQPAMSSRRNCSLTSTNVTGYADSNGSMTISASSSTCSSSRWFRLPSLDKVSSMTLARPTLCHTSSRKR